MTSEIIVIFVCVCVLCKTGGFSPRHQSRIPNDGGMTRLHRDLDPGGAVWMAYPIDTPFIGVEYPQRI